MKDIKHLVSDEFYNKQCQVGHCYNFRLAPNDKTLSVNDVVATNGSTFKVVDIKSGNTKPDSFSTSLQSRLEACNAGSVFGKFTLECIEVTM